LKYDSVFKRDGNAIGSTLKIRFYPLVVESAQGVMITDVDGREYLDFNAGWAVANTGYGHPQILKAVKDQLDKTSFVSTITFLNDQTVKLAERLPRSLLGIFPRRFGSASQVLMQMISSSKSCLK